MKYDEVLQICMDGRLARELAQRSAALGLRPSQFARMVLTTQLFAQPGAQPGRAGSEPHPQPEVIHAKSR